MIPGYRVLETLHEGGNAVVLRGERLADGRPVILKRLAEEFPSPERLASFRQEYTINRKVAADVELCALERVGDDWLMVLDDRGGVSLDRLGLAGHLSIPEFLRLAVEITESVAAAHDHLIIHRDINPANITLNRETGEVTLIDFSASTLLPRASASFANPSVLEGTLPYIAPEQTGRMNRTVDLRADLYALGITLYELLVGETPFTSDDPLELVHSHVAKLPGDPRERRPELPATLAAIILRLLAKNADDRYQSARGLLHDLSRCHQLAVHGAPIELAVLGERDVSDRLHVPETLYGREDELRALLSAFERARLGGCEFALVGGAPGIGKSALVRELYGPITRVRGFFISGKFEQFSRNIPYSGLIQAFRGLVRQLLSESAPGIATWREQLLEALGPNGQVMIRVIPEIELIIGPQPDPPELRSEDAQNRFNLTFRGFIEVFARAEHPLVLFIDDLQWADRASLDLLEVLLASKGSGHLLIVGAHRSNEVDASHPLRMSLERLRRRGVEAIDIDLQPLALRHINALPGDALHCPDAEVAPLAHLIAEKTGGNPFFVGEFLRHLHDDGLLALDREALRWRWDLAAIRQRKITENVVELMAQKVKELAPGVQEVLKTAAALGNRFDLDGVVKAIDDVPSVVLSALWSALQLGFITAIGESVALLNLEVDGEDQLPRCEFRFTHDRIQQALYDLIPAATRPQLHHRIGRHLLGGMTAGALAGEVFTIVGHLNQARGLLESWEERRELGRLNLAAAHRAVDASAFAAALNYFKLGAECLGELGWTRDRELCFALHLGAAEAACMVGDYSEMTARTSLLLGHTDRLLEEVKIHEILIQAKTIQLDLSGAVAMAIDLLRRLDVRISRSPGRLDILGGVLRTKAALAGKEVASFASLPRASAPEVLARAQLLGNSVSAAYRSKPDVFILIALEMVKLSVRHGNTPASGFAYACYALILAGALGDVEGARQFVPVCDEMLGWAMTRPFRAKTLFALGTFVISWIEHPQVCADRLYDGYTSGLEVGDLEFASHCGYIRSYFLLHAADNLRELRVDLEQMADALEPLGQGRAAELCNLYLQVVCNLRGESDDPQRLVSERFDITSNLETSLRLRDARAIVEASLQEAYLAVLFGDREAARASLRPVPALYDDLPGFPPACEARFFDGLLDLDRVPELAGGERRRALRRVRGHLGRLRKWSASSPALYRHLYYALEAELARVEGREGDARVAYDQALAAAAEQRILRAHGLIAELASAFYFGQGSESLGLHFLQVAHRVYLRWGATAKVEALEAAYPQLVHKPSQSLGRGATIHATVALSSSLDLTSVLRASQAISREIVPERLLETLIKVVIESAGADRGLLLQSREEEWIATVEGRTAHDGLDVAFGGEVGGDSLPLSMIHYVARTREVVVRASADSESFADDPYLQQRKIRSILCMPLVNQSRLVGVLYLENSVSDGAFYEARLSFLETLAAQMATSLENSDLFANLERKVELRTVELREANDQLQASNRELDAFARTVAHDLKNPLGTIAGYARYLLDDITEIEGDEVVDVLQRIAETGDQSVRIVEEILLLASVRKGAVQLVPVAMDKVVDGALSRLAGMIREYGATIRRPVAWPRAIGHAPWIEEIWANYISNALKYGGRPPIVEVGAEVEEDGRIRFWVRDNGPGISELEQREVFAEFTRLEGARADGHGLGLSIVKRIAERIDGEVGLTSELGVGSEFFVILAPAPADAVAPPSAVKES